MDALSDMQSNTTLQTVRLGQQKIRIKKSSLDKEKTAQQIQQIEKRLEYCLNTEEDELIKSLNLLKSNLFDLPKIDMSFLKLNNRVHFKLVNGMYVNQGIRKSQSYYNRRPVLPKFGLFKFEDDFNLNTFVILSVERKVHNNLPYYVGMLEKPPHIGYDIPIDWFEFANYREKTYKYEAKCPGIIPDDVLYQIRERINNPEINDVFLVKEIKHQEWTLQVDRAGPSPETYSLDEALIVCHAYDCFYLIGKFRFVNANELNEEHKKYLIIDTTNKTWEQYDKTETAKIIGCSPNQMPDGTFKNNLMFLEYHQPTYAIKADDMWFFNDKPEVPEFYGHHDIQDHFKIKIKSGIIAWAILICTLVVHTIFMINNGIEGDMYGLYKHAIVTMIIVVACWVTWKTDKNLKQNRRKTV